MFFIIYIIIGSLFAFVSAKMASSRNRSSGLWGVLGFFFGIFAVLILAVIGKDNSERVSPPHIASMPATSKFDEISKLKKLLDDGVLTQSEFDAQKSRLLG